MNLKDVLEAMVIKENLQDYKEKHGIKSEKSDPSHSVHSIGFSEKEQKWYGWSHRAIKSFCIGSAYKNKTASTIAQAKQFAIAFANDAS